MAVIEERVWGGCDTLDCGTNVCNGWATAIAESRSRATARRQARRRVRSLKYRRWRDIRRLRCPRECRRKKITYIYSPAPTRGQEAYFRDRRVWWVQYNIRWQYRVACLTPLRRFAALARADAERFWKEVEKTAAAAGKRRKKKG